MLIRRFRTFIYALPPSRPIPIHITARDVRDFPVFCLYITYIYHALSEVLRQTRTNAMRTFGASRASSVTALRNHPMTAAGKMEEKTWSRHLAAPWPIPTKTGRAILNKPRFRRHIFRKIRF